MTINNNNEKGSMMKMQVIKRVGAPPLRFVGEELGLGWSGTTCDRNSTRWTTVTIYRTKGGKIVAEVGSYGNYTQGQGENDKIRAKSCASPAEALDYLIKAEGLGRASREALEAAAESDPAFAAAFKEIVE